MKKSIPTPLSASLVAVFFQPACSVVKSFLSASVPCTFGSSLKNNLPGPHVGKLASEHTIFPPVSCSADNAALIVGSKAGSGFLTWAKSVGICVRRDEITALQLLVGQGKRKQLMLCLLRLIRIDKQTLTQRNKWLLQVGHHHHLSLIESRLYNSKQGFHCI